MNVYEGLPGYYGSSRTEMGPGRAVEDVARELESIFAYELIKSMSASGGEGVFGRLGGGGYAAMFEMELSRVMAERGLGMREMIVEGLQRIEGAMPPLDGDAPKKAPGPDESSGTMPVNGNISSGFGMRRHPISGEMKFHKGVDIASPEGTEIFPALGGRVVFSGADGKYGNTVVIDHGDGLVSRYAHTSQNLVVAGQRVDTTTVIARVGNTGMSTGPHLHFEVDVHGEAVDPMKAFNLEA